jgi:hypothetical protein
MLAALPFSALFSAALSKNAQSFHFPAALQTQTADDSGFAKYFSLTKAL